MNRIRLVRLLGLGIVLLLLFKPFELSASITTGTATSLVDVNQGILPSSGYNFVIGLNIVTDSDDFIYFVRPTFDDVGDDGMFTPLDLAHVAVFRDDGRITGQFDRFDSLVPGAEVFYPDTLSPFLTFTTPEVLPANDDGANAGDDYFIVIRTSDELTDGDDFTVAIEHTDDVGITADTDDVFVDADGTTTSGAGDDPGLADGTALVWFDAADNVYWEDINDDGSWNSGEGIYIDYDGDDGVFNYDFETDIFIDGDGTASAEAGDNETSTGQILLKFDAADNVYRDVNGAYFWLDGNDDGIYQQATDAIILGSPTDMITTGIELSGIADPYGFYAYWDMNRNQGWDSGEDIFFMGDATDILYLGDLKILDILGTLVSDDFGIEASGFAIGALAYNDANGDDQYTPDGTEAIYFMGIWEGANAILSVPDPDWVGFEGTVTTDIIICEAWASDYTPMRGEMEYPDDGAGLYGHSVPDENIRPRPDSGPNVMEEVYADVLKAQLLPLETRIPILAIDAASRGQYVDATAVRLTRVRVTFSRVNQDSSFDPETGLDPLFTSADWLPYSGVAIYVDTNNDGIFDEGDLPLPLDWAFWGGPVIIDAGGNNTWQATLDLYDDGYIIEATADGNYDFFIVIRLDSGYRDDSGRVGDGLGVKYGTDFIAYIMDGDVNFDSRADPSFPSNMADIIVDADGSGNVTSGMIAAFDTQLLENLNTGTVTSVDSAIAFTTDNTQDWTANAYGLISGVYHVTMTSGSAAGYSYLIISNDVDTLTISGGRGLVDLIAAGVEVGDTYVITGFSFFEAADNIYFEDDDASGDYSFGDDIFLDANANSAFDIGEEVLEIVQLNETGLGTYAASTGGSTISAAGSFRLWYYDANGNSRWDSGEDIIYDRPDAYDRYETRLTRRGGFYSDMMDDDRWTGPQVKDLTAVFELRDYTGRRIDATSPVIPLVGLNVTDTANIHTLEFLGGTGETVDRIRVNFANLAGVVPPGFDPRAAGDSPNIPENSDLATLSDNEDSGLSLWRDNKEAGDIGVFDAEDDPIPVNTHLLTWRWDYYRSLWYVILQPIGGLVMHPDDDYTGIYRGDDYFIAIRTSKYLTYGDNIRITIPAGGITFRRNTAVAADALITTRPLIANLPTHLTDLTSPEQTIPASSNPVPVIGLNLLDDSGRNVDLHHIIVEFYNQGGDLDFTPASDLAAMNYQFDGRDNDGDGEFDEVDEAVLAGAALYKDHPTLGRDGVFDKGLDMVIPLASIPVFVSSIGEPYQLELRFASAQDIPIDDTTPGNMGADYFIVIRTSNTITAGDDFSVGIVGWGPERSSYGLRAVGFKDDNLEGDLLINFGAFYNAQHLNLTSFTDTDHVFWHDADFSGSWNSGDGLWIDADPELVSINGVLIPGTDVYHHNEIVIVRGNLDPFDSGYQLTEHHGFAYDDTDAEGIPGDGIYQLGQDIYRTSTRTYERIETNILTNPVITTTVLSNLVAPHQIIDATSEPTAVVGINVFDDLLGTLDAITIDFTSVAGFAVTDLMLLTATDLSGVAFYRDSDIAGVNGQFDPYDTLISVHPTLSWLGSSVTLDMTQGEFLPPNDTGPNAGADFFVVIRTSDAISYHDKFTVSVDHDAIVYSTGRSKANIDLTTLALTAAVPTFLSDTTTTFGGAISPHSSPTAVIGINANDLIEGGGSDGITLDSLRVRFANVEGTDFTASGDLRPLSIGILSGVALYTDDKIAGTQGSFDPEDDIVILASTPAWTAGPDGSETTLTPAVAPAVLDDDIGANAGADFFIVIRTVGISSGDDFTVSIPTDSITYSVGVSGETITTATVTGDIAGNFAPTIELTAPPVEPRTVIAPRGDFLIRWTDHDPDSDALINLYWDSDGSGYDGTLIVGGLREDGDGAEDQYLWMRIPAGVFYIYARIFDGVNDPVHTYAPAPLYVNTAPTIEVTAPHQLETPAVDTYRIQWDDCDPDDNAVISLYFDTDRNGYDRTLIETGLLLENSYTDFYDWDIAGMASGIYYIYARIYDGINPAVYSDRLGSIRVNRRPMVTLIAPDGGEIWTKDDTTNEITWTASDPDGDELTMTIEYSRDGGDSWIALPALDAEGNLQSINDGVYVWDTEVLVDFHPDSLVRVTASDGIDEGFDTSVSTFTIDNRLWTISGRVWTDGAGGIDDAWDADLDTPIRGVKVALITESGRTLSYTTIADGTYTIANVPRRSLDSYMVDPSKAGHIFSPPSHSVEPSSANHPLISDVNFTAAPVYGTLTAITFDYNINPGQVTITWESSAIDYYIYFTDVFGTEFTRVPTVVHGCQVGRHTSWTDDGTLTGGLPDTVPARYYMVRSTIGGIPSPNTVGVFRITVFEGMNLISLPLVPLGDDFTLDTVIGQQLTSGYNDSAADRIWQWDQVTQSYRHAWLKGTWATENEHTLTLYADEGAWVQVRPGREPQDIFVVGEVSNEARSLVIREGMNLIGSAYPVSVALGDADGDGISDSNLKESGARGARTAAQADRVWKWNVDTQSYSHAWLVEGTGTAEDGKWYTGNTETTITLEPGQGYWIQRRAERVPPDYTWTYPKPYEDPPNE